MNFISSPIFLGVIYVITVLELCSGDIQKITVTQYDNNVMNVTTEDIKYLPGFTYNNTVYSLLNGPCNSDEDCLSTSYSCQSQICQSAEYAKDGKVLSAKPGVSVYWIQGKNGINATQGVSVGTDSWVQLYVCRVSIGTIVTPGKLFGRDDRLSGCHSAVSETETHELSYEMLVGPDVEWARYGYRPDKAVYGGKAENGSPYLICRAKYVIPYVIGKLEYPNYNTCFFAYEWAIQNLTTFDVLVHK